MVGQCKYLEALEAFKKAGTKRGAAKLLGLSEATVYRRLSLGRSLGFPEVFPDVELG